MLSKKPSKLTEAPSAPVGGAQLAEMVTVPEEIRAGERGFGVVFILR